MVAIKATLTNDMSDMGVSWALTGGGSLSGEGTTSVTYNAPSTLSGSGPQTVTVTATSFADSTKSASLKITVNPLPQIITSTLPNGTTGTAYNQSIIESGGTPPFTWSVPIGALPLGLSIGASTGVISGTPPGGGTWNFYIRMDDAAGVQREQPLNIAIASNSPPGNPVPFLSQPLVPDAVAPGGVGPTLTINGAGFIPESKVNFDGAALLTSFVNSRQLTTVVPSIYLEGAGTASITVVNPAPGGGRSNTLFFLVASPEVTVNFSNASGSPIAGIRSTFSIVSGDFNGDGNLDLAAVGEPYLYVLLGKGDGTFTQASGSPLFLDSIQNAGDSLPDALAVGDFNNDGKLDLAVADFAYSVNNVPILLGNGDGTLTPSTGLGTVNSQSLCSLTSADFNEDGNLDLAVGNDIFGQMGINILLGYGDGAFTLATGSPDSTAVGTCSMAVGDLNGDRKLDLAVASTTGVNIMLGNGDGTFTPATNSPIAVGTPHGGVAVGDFNDDGKLDIAVGNGTANTVTILLGNGDGTFTQPSGSPVSVGTNPDAIAVADFRGNGKLDLAVANYGSNNVTLLLGNGDGTFTQAPNSPFSAGNSPTSLAVGDFTRSGRLGLAVANAGDNTISILVQ